MAGHVFRGQVPGLVTLVSRCGEVYVETIGAMKILLLGKSQGILEGHPGGGEHRAKTKESAAKG